MSSSSTTWTTDTNTKSGVVQVYESNVSVLKILGIEGGNSILELFADQGDDNADKWRMWVNASDDDLHFANYTSGAWANLLTIQDGGNVGIGTDSPGSTVFSVPGNITTPTILELESVNDATDVGIMLSRPNDYAIGMDMWVDVGTGISYIDSRYNSDAGDIRFRTKTHGTAIDAMTIDGAGNVGIGTSSPVGLLEVADGTTPEILLHDTGATSTKRIFRIAQGGDVTYFQGRNDANTDVGATGTLMSFDMSVGAITMSAQPAFLVKPNASSLNQNVLPGATVPAILNTEIYDQGSNFHSTVKTSTADATETNKLHDADGGFASGDVGSYVYNSTDNTHATVAAFVDSGELTLSADIMASGETYYIHKSTFTAPVTGKYQLTFSTKILNLDSAADYYAVYINTSNRMYTTQLDPDVGQDTPYIVFNWTGLADMDANDTAYITWKQYSGSAQTDLEGDATTAMPTFFSGYLAC